MKPYLVFLVSIHMTSSPKVKLCQVIVDSNITQYDLPASRNYYLQFDMHIAMVCQNFENKCAFHNFNYDHLIMA